MPVLTSPWRPKPPERLMTRFALPRPTSSISTASSWRMWRSRYSRLEPSGAVIMTGNTARSSTGANITGSLSHGTGLPAIISATTSAVKAPAAPSTIFGPWPASERRTRRS